LIKTLLQQKQTSIKQRKRDLVLMKRIQVIIAITFFLIGLVLGLLAASWYDQGNEIRITEFIADLGWHNPVGVTMNFIFNVTIENGSNQNITGTQVTIHRLDEQNSSISGYYPLVDVGVIEPGEIRIVRLGFFFGLEKYGEYKASNYLAILSANGTKVLDESKLW
jgi:hypothetical protein